MRIHVKAGVPEQQRDGVLVFPAIEGTAGSHPKPVLLGASKRDKELAHLVGESGFRGAVNETLLLPLGKQWALIVGLGKAKELSLDHLRQFGGTAVRSARGRGFTRVILPVYREKLASLSHDKDAFESVETVAQAVAEGALLGLYRYDRLHEVPQHERGKRIDEFTLVVERSAEIAAAKRGVEKADVLVEAVALARDLINGPANLVTPTVLANEARKIAKALHLKCTVIPFEQLKRQGFGGIVGVGQGSVNPPQFIVLDYTPPRAKAIFALCGKGITFDTGGISIKPSAKMEQMKYDMSGGAAVLGTLKAAATLKLPVRVIGIVAATENMPSGTAQKPGDVLKTLSGKTVEVLNTDAEGRLVLADCLHYAKRYKPDAVVDLATLTGACVVALGSEAIGLMTQSDRLAGALEEAGKITHERVWRLPLWEEYGGPLIKSDIADLRNVTNTGEAGTITAAKFLEAFAEGLTWAHLDIAGTAWSEKEKPYVPKGAVGIGVRLLIALMERWK